MLLEEKVLSLLKVKQGVFLAVYWIDFQVQKSKRTEEGDVSEVVCVGACFCNSEKGMRDYGGEIL